MGPGETFAEAIKPTFQLGEMDGQTKYKGKILNVSPVHVNPLPAHHLEVWLKEMKFVVMTEIYRIKLILFLSSATDKFINICTTNLTSLTSINALLLKPGSDPKRLFINL